MLPSRFPLCQLYPLPNLSHSFHSFRGHLEWGDSGMCSFNSHCPLKLQIDLPLTSLRNLNSACSRSCMWSPLTQQTYSLDSALAVLSPESRILFPSPFTQRNPSYFLENSPNPTSMGMTFLSFWLGQISHYIIYFFSMAFTIIILYLCNFFDKVWNSCPCPSKLEAGVMLFVFTLASPDLAHCLADGRYPINIHCFHSNNKNNCDYKSLSTRDWTIELGLTFIVPFNLKIYFEFTSLCLHTYRCIYTYANVYTYINV